MQKKDLHGTTIFSGKAEIYADYRPAYPPSLFSWLEEYADLDSAADIGAGTGIFTAQLQPMCGSLTAVEPNADMRQMFQKMLPQIPCLAGAAENIPLPDNSLSLITAAQAFHWFDEDKFRTECRRLLRPAGKLLLVWNNSLNTGAAPEVREVCRHFCPRFRSGHAGVRTPEEGDRFLKEEYFSEMAFFSCPNPLCRTEEQFLGDQLSRSYALPADAPEYEAYLSSLRAVFRKFAVDGLLREEYETTAYLGFV